MAVAVVFGLYASGASAQSVAEGERFTTGISDKNPVDDLQEETSPIAGPIYFFSAIKNDADRAKAQHVWTRGEEHLFTANFNIGRNMKDGWRVNSSINGARLKSGDKISVSVVVDDKVIKVKELKIK